MGWWSGFGRRETGRPDGPARVPARHGGSPGTAGYRAREVDAEPVDRPGPRSRLPHALPRHRAFHQRRAWGGH